MNDFLYHPILAASEQGALEVVLKILGAVVGVIGLLFGIYVAFLNRKWRKDKEHEEEKRKNLQLQVERLVEALRSEFKTELAQLSNFDLRLKQLEGALAGAADSGSMTSLKYLVEADLTELKNIFSRFSDACAQRHEKLAEHGSLADLKARVDGAMRKISSLEDFRHNSADRYLLVVNYQQDIKMITDAISMLREDLRAVIDMVDHLS